MKEIQLTHGYVALVDDQDYEELSRYKWRVHPSRQTYYAIRTMTVKDDGDIARSGKCILMHKQIMGNTSQMVVDHKDRNGLNNTRLNLRWATFQQNLHNAGIRSDNKTGYKGVSYQQSTGKYRAELRVNGVYKYLGLYKTPEEAHRIRVEAATKFHGEFASTGETR